MVVAPGDTPVTLPALLTVATAVLLLLHVTTRPVSEPPSASSVVACSGVDAPTRIDTVAGATTTVATSRAVTVIVAVALLPRALTAIFASPSASAVTTPEDDTVATDLLELDHTNVCTSTTLPAASFGRAARVTDPPARTLAVGGVRSMLLSGMPETTAA